MNALPWWAAVPVAVLLACSGIATLTGSLGLLRLRDFRSRIHAPTLGNTMGAICLLLASIVASLALGQQPVFQEVLILMFLVITSPVTAMLLMRAAMRRDGRDTDSP